MTTEILKELKEEFNKSFADFRKENDKALQTKSALDNEKVDKIGTQIDKVEAEFKKLQLKMETQSALKKDEEKVDEYKGAFNSYLRNNLEGMDIKEKSLILEGKAKLIAGDATMGGYLVRPEFEAIIVKNVTEMDQMRQYARVTQINSRSLIYPKRESLLQAYWVGEQGTHKKVSSTYGQGEIVAHGIGAVIPISDELLQDASVNMETEIAMDSAEAFAYTENLAFTLGNNVTQPEGVLTNTSISRVETATSLTLVADDLYSLIFALKTAYVNGANFFGNRQLLSRIRKFKGLDGQYLLATGQTAGITYTLLGTTWVEMPSMNAEPVLVANDDVIMYGDMFKTYRIVDRIGMSVLRDPYTQKLDNMCEFLFKKRVGGAVTLPEGMKVLKIKA